MEVKQIDNITFGTTYLKSSLQYMSKANQKKLIPSYGLGQIYPVDLFLGSDKKGNLIVEIKKESPFKYMYYNKIVSQTPENYYLCKLEETLNFISQASGMCLIPKEKKVFKFMDLRTEKALVFDIADEISNYFKKYKNQFLN